MVGWILSSLFPSDQFVHDFAMGVPRSWFGAFGRFGHLASKEKIYVEGAVYCVTRVCLIQSHLLIHDSVFMY